MRMSRERIFHLADLIVKELIATPGVQVKAPDDVRPEIVRVLTDESKLDELMGQLVGHMTGSALCFGIWLGDELGLYRTLVDLGPTSADEIAETSGCHPRLVREWLDG